MILHSAHRQDLRQYLLYGILFSLFVFCALPSVAVIAAEQKQSPPSAGIPLADIAAQATEVSNLLASLTARATFNAQIDTIAKALPNLSANLDAEFAATTRSLEAQPSLEGLQALQHVWQRHQVETTDWLNLLTQQATELQKELDLLNNLQKTWISTHSAAQASKAPKPILEQTEATLTAVTTAQAALQTRRAAILDLQSRVAREVTRCNIALAQISQYQHQAVASIFVPDAPPIWRVELWAAALNALPDHARKVVASYRADLVRYFGAPREGAILHSTLFILLALAFGAARRKVDGWKKSGAQVSPALSVFEYPYAAALSAVLVFATSPFFQMPNAIRQLLTVVAVVPTIRLAQPMVNTPVMTAIYTLGILFTIDTLRQAFAGIPMIDQALLVGETLVAILALIWLRSRYRQFLAETGKSPRLTFLRLAKILLIGVLVFSLLAGAVGYARLAHLLTPGIFVGGVLGLAAFAYLRVVGGVVTLALRLWPLRLLRMVETHRELLARRTYILLIWIATFGWLVRYLVHLGLLDPAWSAVQVILAAKLERGNLSISLGDILEFLLIVYLSYLLSRFLRFALQEDFYPRVHLAPGLPYVTSSLLHYAILALGFVAGLSVLGVDLSKVTILVGAFGVGVGFGLQSIVNNFVSGLILLFERPIHVGDTIELGSLQGTVYRIGIRASVIHTGAGADIIVPNSMLITDRVTNWTFSDRLRRIDLPVGVNYGANPKKVIELLEQVARAHPSVLSRPAPSALFVGYGDSSINFELYAWPSNFNQFGQVRSDLATAVYDAINAAGMSFPFPQREVRLVRDGYGDEKTEIVAKPFANPAKPDLDRR